jgi:hypothetical protein
MELPLEFVLVAKAFAGGTVSGPAATVRALVKPQLATTLSIAALWLP